jgi:oligopeptide transport system permease protein
MYFFKRLCFAVPLLLVISALAFLLVRLAPGGPFDRERQPASPEIKRQIAAKYHLDEPSWRQYLRFLSGLACGDFGPSLKYRNHSVTDLIAQGLPVSLTLGALAFGVALGVGIPLGCWGALRRGQWPDWAGGFLALLLVCVPGFVLAPLLILGLALETRCLPPALWGSPAQVVLPVFALGLFFAGRVARLMREGMLNTLTAEYITTARAKGLSEGAVVWRHAFRLAVLPVVTYAGPLLADLLTGSFVIENIFHLPGLGVLLVNGCLNRDYTVVVGLVLLYAACSSC